MVTSPIRTATCGGRTDKRRTRSSTRLSLRTRAAAASCCSAEKRTRKTYQMMASYWPTPMAMQNEPKVAAGINNLPKVVFSRTLCEATWKNTHLVKSDMVAEVRKMKREPGPDMVILGSGSLVAQLGQEGLIDEFQLLVNP